MSENKFYCKKPDYDRCETQCKRCQAIFIVREEPPLSSSTKKTPLTEKEEAGMPTISQEAMQLIRSSPNSKHLGYSGIYLPWSGEFWMGALAMYRERQPEIDALQSQLSSMTDNYQRAFVERDAAYEENRRLLLKTAQLRKVENETNTEEILRTRAEWDAALKFLQDQNFKILGHIKTRQDLQESLDAALKEVGEYRSALTEIASGKILSQWIAQNALSKYKKEEHP